MPSLSLGEYLRFTSANFQIRMCSDILTKSNSVTNINKDEALYSEFPAKGILDALSR